MTKLELPDIDIDFADRSKILDIIEHIPASLEDGKKHNTGVYCHKIPINPLSGVASINYKDAEERGYFKIDFLNAGVYNQVKSEEHLIQLMNTEPLWDLLLQDEFVNLLFHLNGHGDILRKTCPTSVEQLSAVLAMIRPAKRYLIGKPWTTIMKEVWTKPENDEYFFKKSHATAYAVAIVAQMNLICEEISQGYS
jgi:DNA polymerase III alpha subunit